MRRRISKLVLFLLLGAVVNVAVAWGFAVWATAKALPSKVQLMSGARGSQLTQDPFLADQFLRRQPTQYPGGCIDDICVDTGFPIRIHGPGTAKSKRGSAERRFSWKSGHIKPLPRRLKAAIEALQPYKRGRGYRKNLLWLLEKLNNTDKHRMLVLLIQKAHGTSITVNRGKIDTVVVGKRITMYTETGQLEIIPRIKLKEGTKVAHLKGRLPDGVNVGVVIAPTMVFGDACRAVKSLPVFPTLGEICNHVSDVVESFAPEFPAT